MTDNTPAPKAKTVSVKFVRKTPGHALGDVVEVSVERAERLLKARHAVKA